MAAVIDEPQPPPLPPPFPEVVETIQPNSSITARAGGPSFFSLHPRLLRRAIFWGIWIGPAVALLLLLILGSIAQGDPTAAIMGFICVLPVLGVPWLMVGGWISLWLTPVLMSGLVRTVCCPHCHETYPLVCRWSCGCGYTDHRERHLYRFRCPKCNDRLGYYQCERCDATMLF